VTLTHDGQVVLCEGKARCPFQVRNFMSVLGEAMGIGREDLYKRYTLAGGADAAVQAAEKLLQRNRLARSLEARSGRVDGAMNCSVAWGAVGSKMRSFHGRPSPTAYQRRGL
jgi:hypothetical protein